MAIRVLPFRIGRQADNQLVMRDNRASRVHASIAVDQGEYWIEDLNSRHGTFVNGAKIQRHKLQDSDRIDFGSKDSYQLTFLPSGGQVPLSSVARIAIGREPNVINRQAVDA